jgi:hypothetical protein
MDLNKAKADWAAHRGQFEAAGVYLPDVQMYVPDGWGRNFDMAMDAQPALQTTPNSAVPALLTTMIDPQVFKVLFSPNKAAIIFGEERKGTWLDETMMFPTVEYTGEVSSYGDFVENGRAGVNTNWPQRQSYLFQVMKEYGERELERAGLARINWVTEIDASAANALNKFSNLTYFFGVAGLQNYGLTNDPGLSAALTPATKAAGGTKWINNGVIVATANEIFADIESTFIALVNQNGGLVDRETKMTLVLSPANEGALTTTNSFNVNVSDLLKKNFPNIRVESAVQYGVLSSSNPQGITGGNLMQLIADEVDGQDVGYAAFNEKMRAHKLIPATSSYRQKVTAGTWGAIIRQPFGISQMLGI